MTDSALSRRYVVTITSRCRATVEVEASSKSEAREKARRLEVADDHGGFDGWQIAQPMHVEASAAEELSYG